MHCRVHVVVRIVSLPRRAHKDSIAPSENGNFDTMFVVQVGFDFLFVAAVDEFDERKLLIELIGMYTPYSVKFIGLPHKLSSKLLTSFSHFVPVVFSLEINRRWYREES